MRKLSLLLLLSIFITFIRAQDGEIFAVRDSVCVDAGEGINYNVTDNDDLSFMGDIFVFLSLESECIGMDFQGNLFFLPGAENCCGEHILRYRYENCGEPNVCEAEIVVVVKCPKPNCAVVDLSDYLGMDDPSGNPDTNGCVVSCENALATYYLPYDNTSIYNWSVTGGTFSAGSNPAEIDVLWGATGSGSINLSITNSANVTTSVNICVDILPAPVADFEKSADTICLNSTVFFTNTSTDGNDWFWDFGDGFTSASYSPSHEYSGPGTYTVLLTVTKDNFGADGEASCCCTDTMSMDIVVDPLPGPDIQWISTLCAGDSSKYWTTATNCSNYRWTVLDENDLAVSFTGQSTDTICVAWGDGPFGQIFLDVNGCDDDYCPVPATAIVPIISPTTIIDGLVEVCENGVATYTAPKWASVAYDWQVSGGDILSGMGTNTIVVQWGAAPGPGTIDLNYFSDFLGGLPGQDPENCGGSGTLSVDIRPAFDIGGPTLVCAGTNSSFFATSFPSNSYTWTISPAASFTGQGSAFINVNWNNGPGTYLITATPNDPTAYCNDAVNISVRVLEVPKPTGIEGAVEICPGETATYFGQTSESGVGFSWVVTGGSPTSALGNPLEVNWGATGPYRLELRQFLLSNPFCTSDSVLLDISPKDLFESITVSGPSGCTNDILSYVASPGQHPDTDFQWIIDPPNAGSVIAGQGTPNATVQWNALTGTHTVQVTVSLCDESAIGELDVDLENATPPTITQSGVLCPGGSATLDAGGGYSNYNWSTGATSQVISITAAGTYLVTVTNAGCTAIGTYTATDADGPVASISTGDPTVLCSNPPNNTGSVTINALTGAGYTFAWYCNGELQALPTTQAFFIHNNTMADSTFTYYVEVTDADNCTNQSNTITVIQSECGGNGGCDPQDYMLSFAAVNQDPDCNIVDFTVSSSPNVTLISWDFNDPDNNTNGGSLPNAQHTYGTAGCYLVELTATVPAEDPDEPDCIVEVEESICVPLAANFSATVSCLDVTFCDLSTFLPGEAPTNWSWNFGDSNTSSDIKPTHGYLNGGTYTVTLIVSNGSGCSATFVDDVTVDDLPSPSIATSSPTCVGFPIDFTGSSATGIISWLWDFGDGSTNGSQNPSHTYGSSGTYTVTLTVVDELGCENQVSTMVTVFAAPPADTIGWSPALQICAGESVTLTAPAGAGYSYNWSTGATSPSITVSAAGTYGVTVTDDNDCTLVPDSVTVTVYPLPEAQVSGPTVICDEGCITLQASLGFGYTYQWYNNGGVLGAVGSTLSVCDNTLSSPYFVEISDANGCVNTSALHSITLETSPLFTVNVTPDSCEGTVSTLSVNPVQPDVLYSWSTGETGISIDVLQAGVYTAFGTDTLTGCGSSASATIYPLPDLCLVPVGCYEACNPDTISGPGGLDAYQWNLNGVPIAGATDSFLIVNESGTYSLTGTTEFGCELTSDSLILDIIDCGCEGLDVTATPSPTDSCCWTLSYENGISTDLLGLNIYTNDANLDVDVSSLSEFLLISSSTSNSVGLAHVDGLPLPEGSLADFISFCFSEVENTPQQLIVDWYDFDFAVACSDTLYFECPVEPNCLYTQADTIYCGLDGEVVYEFTLCNPTDALFSIGYVDITPFLPGGVTVTPPSLELGSDPIVAGECRTFSFILGGTFAPGEEFCYNLLGHESDPNLVDTALCCSLDTLYCVTIPDCDPCDDIGVEFIEPLTDEAGSCCYSIGLFNEYEPDFFDGIGLCVLSPATTLTVDNPFGSGWTTTASSPTAIQLTISPPLGNSLPFGSFSLPDICLHTENPPVQLVEIKWLIGDSVVCRDTIALECEPPCGYIVEEEVFCNSTSPSSWTYNGVIKNTSDFTMGEANIVFTSPAGLSSYNISLPLGGLAPGGFFPFSIPIGAPAMAGDTVCFTVALHELGDDDQHTNCCNFSHCFVLPECDISPECICNEDFFDQIGMGIDCSPTPEFPGVYVFTPAGDFTQCDEVEWTMDGLNFQTSTIGNEAVEVTINDPGEYQICMKVARLDLNGEICEEGECKEFIITEESPVVYPNPSSTDVTIVLPPTYRSLRSLQLLDAFGQRVLNHRPAGNTEVSIRLDVSNVPPGVYWLYLETESKSSLLKLVIL
ncbi:hypothetical protein CEQ90_04645 [Lewinellaceae bacterium SD302]|nr:hypothetical protein CEQ90_04645 [Lewinellaceae bacterium SD302]